MLAKGKSESERERERERGSHRKMFLLALKMSSKKVAEISISLTQDFELLKAKKKRTLEQ